MQAALLTSAQGLRGPGPALQKNIQTSLQRAYAAQNLRAADTSTPWQLAFFLAAPNRSVDETLSELRGKINWGSIAVATVLDVSAGVSADITKCACGKGSCKKTSAPPVHQATLYVLYRQNGITHEEKHTFPVGQDPVPLWEELLKNLQTGKYYTGVLIDAHSSGLNFFYGGFEHQFSSQLLVDVLARSNLQVDLLELHSCHMSSLSNIYQWTKKAQIDYVVASSDVAYSSADFMYYRLLRFLQYSPRQVATRSVQDRLKQFHFSSREFATTNAAALHLAPLRRPMQAYARAYKKLLSYKGTEDIDQAFAGYFNDTDEDWDWKSLRQIVAQQKKYVQTHLEPQFYNFYADQQQFVSACEELLRALSSATLTQWCYSSKDDKVYQNTLPAQSGCLESVSVNSEQFWELYD